mmetsp:Transcript_31452/g.65153  ORF Transcript_31452/g.65153 Transcript_31452/m.65153 type:complete len:216 (+) Transcript_31452:60-707(+)
MPGFMLRPREALGPALPADEGETPAVLDVFTPFDISSLSLSLDPLSFCCFCFLGAGASSWRASALICLCPLILLGAATFFSFTGFEQGLHIHLPEPSSSKFMDCCCAQTLWMNFEHSTHSRSGFSWSDFDPQMWHFSVFCTGFSKPSTPPRTSTSSLFSTLKGGIRNTAFFSSVSALKLGYHGAFSCTNRSGSTPKTPATSRTLSPSSSAVYSVR